MLADAPLLGNGELGVMVEHEGHRLSFYVGRADFRRYALGGVDVVVKDPQAAGGKVPSSRHEQDIERAEIRSKVELVGRMVEATTWLVPDQPLMICEISNPSGQALSVQVKTWARGPVNDFSQPFRLKAGHLSTYPINQSLNDREGKVVYGKPVLENAELWRYFKDGNIWCLRNEATGRYMAITKEGEVITTEKPDTAYFRRIGQERQGMVQWAANGRYLNAPYDRDAPFTIPEPLPVLATPNEAPYATATEAAAHFFNPTYAGHVDDLTWASRSYMSNGTRSSACLVSRVLDAKASVQDATQEVVIPAKGRITLAVAIPGAINQEKRTASVESLRDKATAMLRDLTAEKIHTLQQQRLDFWREYWLKAWVDTGDDLLNKYWFGSMYLLRCGNQIGQQSPALLGVWNMSDNPACTNREFNNYNYQSQHYATFTANRADYSEVLGVDADKREKWRDIAKRMSEYPSASQDGKTVFRETESNPRITLQGPGDNVSLLQIIHPGEGIGLDSDPKRLEIARNTLDYMNSDPKNPSWMQIHNNLPLIFTQAATIGGDGDDIYQWLRHYMEERLRPNLTPQPWGMESVGGTEAIHRMMFQSRGEHPLQTVLRFFPVWPESKDASFTRLRGCGAFLVSAFQKNGVVGGIEILSEKGSFCTLVNPWPGKEVRVIRNGKQAELIEGDRFTLNTAAGEILEIKVQ